MPSCADAGEAARDGAGDTVSGAVWSVRGQTVEKPVNDCFNGAGGVVWRQSEDRFCITENENTIVAAVADGAGSSGMYCGAWAEALVDKLPRTPIGGIDALNQWIDGIWQDFSNTHKQRAAGDPVKLNKFVREGSCSTLIACWIDKNGGDAPVLNWMSYGDSHFCAFNEQNGEMHLLAGFPQTLGAMASDPNLLNWKDLPDENHLRTGRMELTGPGRFVLASDGVGEFLHFRYLAELHARFAVGGPAQSDHAQSLLVEFRQLLNGGGGKFDAFARKHLEQPGEGFAREFDALVQALESQESFREAVKRHHADGLLSNDDATLIVIDFDNIDANACNDDCSSHAGGEVIRIENAS